MPARRVAPGEVEIHEKGHRTSSMDRRLGNFRHWGTAAGQLRFRPDGIRAPQSRRRLKNIN